MDETSATTWGIWGNRRVVRELHRAAIFGPRHAYIVSGPDGVGKRTLALAFAKALACVTPPGAGLFCGTCSSCRRIERGTHPDVTIADLASQVSREKSANSLNIATVREVSANVSLRPIESRWRVAVVDDVETMQETAQEAFLKTLEEPPGYAILLLLTTDADLLLPTIRSRCVTLTLQPVSNATIVDGLVAGGVAGSQAATIAEASDGLPGWAIRASGDATMLEAATAARRDAEAWARGGEYERLVRATRIADEFSKDRESVFARLLSVQAAWRIMLLESAEDTSVMGPRDIVAALKSVERCIVDLEANVRPRLALQQMVLQWPSLT